jgi:hypothetical protein
MPANEEPTKPRGRCWTCGYRLDAIPSHRCPECGRAFDPDDPTTMNMIGPVSRLARWMITHPLGWPTLLLAALATTAIAATTRWPVGPFTFNIRYLLAPVHILTHATSKPATFWSHLGQQTWTDLSFVGGLSLLALLLAALALRSFWRWRLARHYAPVMVPSSRRRLTAFFALIVVSVLLIPVGADYRLAKDWTAAALTARTTAPRWNPPEFAKLLPWSVPAAHEDDLLRCALRRGNADERHTAAGIIVETRVARGLPLLREAYVHETDPDVRAALLTLIALYRDAGTADLLAAALDDRAPAVRTAAADALGILHAPAFPIPFGSDPFWSSGTARYQPFLHGRPSPVVYLSELVDRSIDPARTRPSRTSADRLRDTPIALPDSLRQKIERMMLAGQTQGEREAAARALLRWPPPDYSLRVAEWGVWIDDHGDLKLVQSVLDDIPPLVHRFGNSQTELAARINRISIITKPIIHVAADKPLAVDLDVQISLGRPWYAYPLPDDFSVVAGDFGPYRPEYNFDGTPKLDAQGNPVFLPSTPTLAGLDPPPGFPHFDGARQGFPGFLPEHPTSGSIGGWVGSKNDFASVGVRWQSLIVTPQLPPWAALQSVPADGRYQWWNRLRQVKSDYVISRGEVERFLYYDGPTNHSSHVSATLSDGKFHIINRPPDTSPSRWAGEPPFTPTAQSTSFPRAGLVIRVPHAAAGVPARPVGFTLPDQTFASASTEFPIPATMPDDAEPLLLQLLTSSGLTADEAAGLIDTWRPQFLQTPGNRLLIRLSSDDYDRLCPLTIQPQPTQLVRVGLILIELGVTK